MLTTERLILRRWEKSDANDLYTYAKDPAIGPSAGWPAHTSVEESLRVIENYFQGKEAYAVCLKADNRAIGAIELKLYGNGALAASENECELGFWVGKPFWGQGIIPEAAQALLCYAFEERGMQKVWCGYYEGNEKSARTQQKLGFTYCFTKRNAPVPLLNEVRTEIINCLSKQHWQAMQKQGE